MKRLLAVLVLALGIVTVPGVLDSSHFTDAGASWATCHSAQSVHELSNPPASWPGTRAAHVTSVQLLGGGLYLSNQTFYTKSGFWDPTWDYYKSLTTGCP